MNLGAGNMVFILLFLKLFWGSKCFKIKSLGENIGSESSCVDNEGREKKRGKGEDQFFGTAQMNYSCC